jgi:hypothetical protein
MKRTYWYYSLLCFVFSFSITSCFEFGQRKPPVDPLPETVREEAYVPVYDSTNGIATERKIVSAPEKPIVNSGKIYVLGNYLFQVEQLQGVHVINYADKSRPQKIGFIKSRGCSEVAAKGAFLILNNMNDLVTIDISDPRNVKEKARINNAFPQFYVSQYQNSLPPVRGKYYVCADYYKGEVVGWRLEKNVKGAYCYSN